MAAFFVIQPIDQTKAMWLDLISRFGAATGQGMRTLRAIGWAAFNTARIEAGRPLFGIDL